MTVKERYELERIPTPCGLTRHSFIDCIRYIRGRKETGGELILCTDDKHPERNGWYIILTPVN